MARKKEEAGARIRIKAVDGKKYVLAEDLVSFLSTEMIKHGKGTQVRQTLWGLVSRLSKLCPEGPKQAGPGPVQEPAPVGHRVRA
jgi:hypothetical protein